MSVNLGKRVPVATTVHDSKDHAVGLGNHTKCGLRVLKVEHKPTWAATITCPLCKVDNR